MPHPARHLAPLLLAVGLPIAPALAQSANPGFDRLFARLDADGDGRITQAEVAAAKARPFVRADRDGDGRVTPADLAAVHARIDRAVTAMEAGALRLDRDGDGALSLAEFTARTPLFDLLDIDGDGAISRAEAERARTILQR